MKVRPETIRRQSNRILAHLTETFAPLLHALARRRCGCDSTPPEEWKKGVLIGADHIGDVLWISASLPHLHKGLPNCEWYYLLSPPADQVVSNNPALAGTIVRGGNERDTRRQLAERKFDVVLCYNTGMYWRDLFLAVSCGIPNRAGYVHKGVSGLVTHPVSIHYPQPYPAYFRDFVGQIAGLEPDWPLTPDVHVGDEHRAAAEAFWHKIGATAATAVIACFVTARQATPQWPIECYAQALKLLWQKHHALIVLCGATSDEAVLRRLAQAADVPCTINAGKLKLLSLVAFLQKCTVAISTDSGPRHLANAAELPVVYIRNLWFSRVEAGKYAPTDHDLGGNEEYLAAPDHEVALRKVTPEILVQRVSTIISRERGPGGH